MCLCLESLTYPEPCFMPVLPLLLGEKLLAAFSFLAISTQDHNEPQNNSWQKLTLGLGFSENSGQGDLGQLDHLLALGPQLPRL